MLYSISFLIFTFFFFKSHDFPWLFSWPYSVFHNIRALHIMNQLCMSLLWSHVRESGLRNMENFCLWDPESGKTKLLGDGQNHWNWNQEYSSRNLESLWLESRIQALLTETEIQYLESQIQNPRLFWIPLHAAATVFFDKASDSELLSWGALTSIIMTNS